MAVTHQAQQIEQDLFAIEEAEMFRFMSDDMLCHMSHRFQRRGNALKELVVLRTVRREEVGDS